MLEMLFKALGISDDQIAELRALLDPEAIKQFLAKSGAEYAAVREQLDRIERKLDAIETKQAMIETVTHGGTSMHPNAQKFLDDALLTGAETGEIAFIPEPKSVREQIAEIAPSQLIAAELPPLGELQPAPLAIPTWLQHLKKESENERRDSDNPADGNGDGNGG